MRSYRKYRNDLLSFVSPKTVQLDSFINEKTRDKLDSIGHIQEIKTNPNYCGVCGYAEMGIVSKRKYPLLEETIEEMVCLYLQNNGIKFKRQLEFNGGVIDILTENEIIEIKKRITNNELFNTIGQILYYKSRLKEVSTKHKNIDMIILDPMNIHIDRFEPLLRETNINLINLKYINGGQ